MHFIERLFGASPDGGSGVLEFCLFFIPFAALGIRGMWKRATNKLYDSRNLDSSGAS
jgi:hypothetical protein